MKTLGLLLVHSQKTSGNLPYPLPATNAKLYDAPIPSNVAHKYEKCDFFVSSIYCILFLMKI
jgi:hypothetical protein